ncbi:GH1 family beta-glucosidase [Rhizobium mongolense]|uniref:GH1 family beta-glucosidase n=1 Tax=Rhizobium mongolense TaxID=57676 RepID=UPI0034A5D57E
MSSENWLPASSRLRSRDFLFGVATASFQIEGSTEVDGRLPSIWDTYCDTPGKVTNGDTGKVACDHYNRWAEDVELIASLGLDAYRLSLAWPRLITREGKANDKGFDFYKRLLDALGEKGIKRFVTLYHWDLPQWIEDRGGWVSRETAYRYAEYVDIATRELAGRVEAWATFNEPWCTAWIGYAEGRQAPGHTDPVLALAAGHHLMLGHGLAVPVIRRNDPGAKVGIVLNLQPATAATDTRENRHAAKLAEVGQNDWFLGPLLKGQYDARFFELRGAVPAIVPGDLDIIQQPLDYLGVNYYFRAYVGAAGAHGYKDVPLNGVERTQMGWEVYPEGLTYQLVTISQDYPNLPPVYITENGMASDDKVIDGKVEDDSRIRFFERHLAAVSDAIDAGVEVSGYFAWSLMDNFEWSYGYEKRFGICHVDYGTQVRTPKKSAYWLRDFVSDRS